MPWGGRVGGCHLTTYPKGAKRMLWRGMDCAWGCRCSVVRGRSGLDVFPRCTRGPVFGALRLPSAFPDHALLALSLGWRCRSGPGQEGSGTCQGDFRLLGGPRVWKMGKEGNKSLEGGVLPPPPTSVMSHVCVGPFIYSCNKHLLLPTGAKPVPADENTDTKTPFLTHLIGVPI